MGKSNEYNQRREAGLCSSCGTRPSRPSKTKCAICALSTFRTQQTRQKRRVLSGACRRCGNQPLVNEVTLCGSCHKKQRAYQKTNAERNRANARAWYKRNTKRSLQTTQAYKRRLKTKILAHYGTYCQCCGETKLEFLTLDHINGKGNEHRRQVSQTSGGHSFYATLIKMEYPLGLQVLCWNCNMAKAHFDECPHLQEAGRADQQARFPAGQ